MSVSRFSLSREGVGGPTSVRVPVEDASRVGEVRRTATALADAAGLADGDRARLALVATEVASNLAKHAPGKGVVFLRALAAGHVDSSGGPAVEVLAVDAGAGIPNVGRALEDGYSTAGTPGGGLGAIRRTANEFDLYSGETGTVLMARVRSADAAPAALDTGVVCIPVGDERACGDAWRVDDGGARLRILVVDGLGHGPDAAAAADAAVELFARARGERPAALVELAHGALRGTRGAAIAVAELDPVTHTLHFAGIGNIVGSVVDGTSVRSMASGNGTVGLQMRSVHEYAYPCPAGALVVLHTDGLSARWRLDAYPGLVARPASTIAGVLHRDFARARDDATVLVLRPGRGA